MLLNRALYGLIMISQYLKASITISTTVRQVQKIWLNQVQGLINTVNITSYCPLDIRNSTTVWIVMLMTRAAGITLILTVCYSKRWLRTAIEIKLLKPAFTFCQSWDWNCLRFGRFVTLSCKKKLKSGLMATSSWEVNCTEVRRELEMEVTRRKDKERLINIVCQ